jgi:hypothetical protein
MSIEESLTVPNIPLDVNSAPNDIVFEGQNNISGEQPGKESPANNDATKSTTMDRASDAEAETVVLDDPKGPLDGRLRQRTPGLDYLRLGNPQARGSRSKPTSKSDCQGARLPMAAESSGAEGNPPPPSSS